MILAHRSLQRLAKYQPLSLGLLFLLAAGCTDDDRLGPSGVDPTSEPAADELTLEEADPVPTLASATARGFTFGSFDLETHHLGSMHNATLRSPGPSQIVSLLRQIRAKGGRVIIALADPEDYKSGGRFSLSKWKAQVAKFRRVNFKSYIDDGTIIGHYMIDEPDDPGNWRGSRVSPSTLEEMAKFSKSIWPKMPTIVRVEPGYLKGARHVDAAWAQYSARRGDARTWIRSQASKARGRGVALVVSLNTQDGGNGSSGRRGYSRGKHAMSAAELKKYGSALIGESHACAFFMWKYVSSYYNRSDIKSAMTALSRQAKSRSRKSCNG
jgi:hypothetical protein